MSQTAERPRSILDEFGGRPDAPGAAPTDNLPAVVEPAVLGVLQRAEIDAQHAVAAAHPRSLKVFRQTVRDLAMINADVAAECTYVLPGRKRKDGTTGDEIEGPSIRFAEILAYSFSHGRFGARIIDEAYDHVTAQGVFSDQQNNNTTTFEYSRRITDARGRRYGADMINMTKNAACSIAKRNAILAGIPRPLWEDIWQETRRFAAGSEEQLRMAVDKAVDAFIKAGAPEERILAVLGVTARSGMDNDALRRLRGFYTALRDGEATIGELFPGPAAAVKETSELDQFAKDTKPKGSPGPDTSPGGDGGSAAPHADTAAPADAGTPASSPASADYQHAIDLVLRMAGDKKVHRTDRLADLRVHEQTVIDQFPDDPDFVEALFSTATKIADEALQAAAGRRFLEGEAAKRRTKP